MLKKFYNSYFRIVSAKSLAGTLLLAASMSAASAQYCTPTGALNCASFDDYIENVTFGTINNTTACGSGGYTVFTTPVPTVNPGATYPNSVTVGVADDLVSVWVDFNRNNTFDASEYVALSAPNASLVCTGNIAVPAGASVGTTRMRVRTIWLSQPASGTACTATGTWGEVEDYTINIAPNTAPSCVTAPLTPANNATGLCAGTTLLRWNKVANTTSYDVYLNPGTGAPTTIVSTSQTDTFYNANTAAGGSFTWKAVPKNGVGPATGCGFFTFSTAVGVTPTASITVAPNDTVCANTPTTFTATITNGGTTPTYQWMKNNVNVGTGGPSYTDNGLLNNDSIKVVMTSSSTTCLTSSTATSNIIKMTILPTLPAAVTSSGPLAFCAGGGVTLNTAAGGITYQWTNNNQPIAGATSRTYTANYSGVYRVIITGASGCPAVSDSIRVVAYATPYPQVNRNGNDLSTAPYYMTYQWYRGSQAIPGATTNVYTITRDGMYSVSVMDTAGCSGNSIGTPVNSVSVGTVGSASIHIYPNPASSMIYINAPESVNASIRSMDGKLVLYRDNARELNISELANGIYSLYISDKNGQTLKIEKLVKTAQ